MTAPKTLLVEGWRYFPHSYAIVNQFLCLEFLKRPEVRLFHRDVPFVGTTQAQIPLWPAEDEARLRSIPAPPPDLKPDAVLRLDWPHRFEPDPAAARTFVWGTTEFKLLEKDALPDYSPADKVLPHIKSTIITCSKWAQAGFLNSGAPPAQVASVSCGADPDLFYPAAPHTREAIRKELGWDGKFVLLHISSLSANKGADLLFKTVAKLAAKHPNLLLALKGGDALYRSGGAVQGTMLALAPAEANRLRPRLWYSGEALTFAGLLRLYQGADAYVAPYLAEGFNLPALEAAACGLPVVCTRGGPTDHFAHDDFMLRINSYEKLNQGRTFLVPNPVHFEELLARVITNLDVRARAAAAGPTWVRERFTWKHSADAMLRVLFPG